MQFCHSKWTVIIKSKVLVIRTSRICQVFFKIFQFGPNVWKSSLPSLTIPYLKQIVKALDFFSYDDKHTHLSSHWFLENTRTVRDRGSRFTVTKNRSITLKLLPKKTKPIFSTLDTYWTCPHQQILCTSLVLGGAAIIFSKNWNFELKFVLVNPHMKKIGSMLFLKPLEPKNESKIAKNCQLQ